MNNKQDAEDTAQEVFIQVYKSLESFREDAKISTWIYQISVSKSLDLIRSRNRKKRIGFFKNLVGLDTFESQKTASEELNPEENFEANERKKVLHEAINSLPESQRIALNLTKFDGFSYQETAKIMEVSVSSVESLLFRAKKNLQKKLSTYYEKNF